MMIFKLPKLITSLIERFNVSPMIGRFREVLMYTFMPRSIDGEKGGVGLAGMFQFHPIEWYERALKLFTPSHFLNQNAHLDLIIRIRVRY